MHSFLSGSFLFILGAVFGSFFNVCIHRLPKEESIVSPGSRCPGCMKPIAWHDNIPIASYFILRGRCRNCGGRISPRYPIVEAITGLFFLWSWWYLGPTLKWLFNLILFSLLFIASVVDLDEQIIPDEISLGGLLAGLALSTVCPMLHGETVWWRGLLASLVGGLAGGSVIYATGVLGTLIFRKEAMGGGDVKLLAMLGTFLGWEKALLTFFLAPLLALPLGLFLKFKKREDVLPYGPFLSLAGWLAFLWGEPMIKWYFYGFSA